VTNRRAALVSFILGLVSILLLMLYMRRYERDMSGGERVRLVVALKPIKRGTLITEDLLSTRDVPVAYVEDRAIKANEASKIIGIRAATQVAAQGLLMWTDLAVASEERDLSSLVQPGKRAMTVRASNNDERKSNALIRPGDYVDVLVTVNEPEPDSGKPSSKANDSKLSSESGKSVVLLQRILVLAIGLDTEPQAVSASQKNKQQTSRDMVLTLSLNLQEGQLLQLASEKGHLSVAVRNPEDQRVVDGIPDMPTSALFDSAAREKIQNSRRSQPTPPPAPAPAPTPEGPIKLRSVSKR
jgi:pilus assembly protein CpaB